MSYHVFQENPMTAPDSRDSVELLPCPFCGSVDRVYYEVVEPHTHKVATFMPDYEGGAMVTCGNCCAAHWRDGKDALTEVVAAWNNRQALARGPQQAGGEDDVEVAPLSVELELEAALGHVGKSPERLAKMAAAAKALEAEIARLRAGIVHRGDDVVVPLDLYDEINATGAAWKQRAEAAEAALREARELLFQVKNFGGTKAGALDAFLARTDKGP